MSEVEKIRREKAARGSSGFESDWARLLTKVNVQTAVTKLTKARSQRLEFDVISQRFGPVTGLVNQRLGHFKHAAFRVQRFEPLEPLPR